MTGTRGIRWGLGITWVVAVAFLTLVPGAVFTSSSYRSLVTKTSIVP